MDTCPRCGGSLAIRNPTGRCDHLKSEYYGDAEMTTTVRTLRAAEAYNITDAELVQRMVEDGAMTGGAHDPQRDVDKLRSGTATTGRIACAVFAIISERTRH